MPSQFPTPTIIPTSYNLATYNGSLPNKATLTGTFSSSGVTVTGTSTLFTTELQRLNSNLFKYYLYNASTGEIRSILRINSDTELILNVAFASDLSSATIYGISTSLGGYNAVKLYSAAACTIGLVDQAVITTTASVEWSMVGGDLTPIAAISVAGASGTLYLK